jgi:hypothetical protein
MKKKPSWCQCAKDENQNDSLLKRKKIGKAVLAPGARAAA